MNILILHPSFPGQFVYLAEFLAASKEHNVVFLTKDLNDRAIHPNVQVAVYKVEREVSKDIHAYLRPTEEAVLEGQAVIRAAHTLKDRGFVPDVMIGHTGWGSLMYLKDLYPDVPVIGYFEWFYHALNSDGQWWPDEKIEINDILRVRTKNAHHLLSLDACDIGYTPTQWQYEQFPKEYQPKLRVIHDGVDTEFLQPKADVKLVLDDIKLDLSAVPEIVTYVSRGFEAYRGFPQFMDSIRILLARRPNCHVVIVGNDKVCYGAKLPADKSYQQLEEDKGGYDTSRVHFVGPRNRGDYLKILQASKAHIYLTRPFILSWSMLEAMSIGCPLVASATPPVEEVVVEGENGLLANFRSPEHIAMRVEELLENPELAQRLGKGARETILEKYELKKCLQQQVNLMFSKMK